MIKKQKSHKNGHLKGLPQNESFRLIFEIFMITTNIFISGINGQLVASSPIIDITKKIMGKTGQLEEGILFPEDVRLTIPITTSAKQPNDVMKTWSCPRMRVMQKMSNQTLAEDEPEIWEDISEKNTALFHPVQAQRGESVALDARIPSKLMILIFDEIGPADPKPPTRDISDMCLKIKNYNNIFEAAVMVHQNMQTRGIISK